MMTMKGSRFYQVGNNKLLGNPSGENCNRGGWPRKKAQTGINGRTGPPIRRVA